MYKYDQIMIAVYNNEISDSTIDYLSHFIELLTVWLEILAVISYIWGKRTINGINEYWLV